MNDCHLRRPARSIAFWAAAAAAIGWLTAAAAAQRPDLLIADFEGPDYGDWKAEGEAFGPGPARGTLPKQMSVTGFEGKGLVSSFFGGDGPTGALTSQPVTIERKHVNFLIGGGMHPGETCINLLVDGQAVRTATGPNDRPGGSEALDWQAWDVEDLIGRQAVIQIVDRQKGGWGHINVDQIVQSDRKRSAGPARREIVVQKRYLHLPVTNGARRVRMKVTVGDQIVDEFDVELASGEPDFWVFLDMGPYQGRMAMIDVDRLADDSGGLAAVKQEDGLPGGDELYHETYRPQFHFSPRRGWNNDPNGLVYDEGRWHLYFQHNPYGWKWGNMHWGHAVSDDLVHWTELPIAIYPYSYGDWVFSGGALIDKQDTAGFKTGERDVIVAAYTSTGRGEAIAWSNDGGLTFTDYEGNPVVTHKGRDPKIIWYAPGKHWVMAVYDELDGSRGIAFYTSPDLKQWTRESRIDGYFECPEIFELPVDGDRRAMRWVVYAADGAYAVGAFDGKTFTPEHEGKHRFNWGNCFYASQTYSDVPPEDGRRVQIAWGRTGDPSMPFNQQMDFPVELTLRTIGEGIRMFAEPVREIELLHQKSHELVDAALDETNNPLAGITGELLHVCGEIELGDASQVDLTLRGQTITYDVAEATLGCRGRSAPLAATDGRIRLEVLVDRLSVEIFGGAGRVYMPVAAVLPVEDLSLSASAKGGKAVIRSMTIHELRSAWAK
jgi:fructan beta-fructosidase